MKALTVILRTIYCQEILQVSLQNVCRVCSLPANVGHRDWAAGGEPARHSSDVHWCDLMDGSPGVLGCARSALSQVDPILSIFLHLEVDLPPWTPCSAFVDSHA